MRDKVCSCLSPLGSDFYIPRDFNVHSLLVNSPMYIWKYYYLIPEIRGKGNRVSIEGNELNVVEPAFDYCRFADLGLTKLIIRRRNAIYERPLGGNFCLKFRLFNIGNMRANPSGIIIPPLVRCLTNPLF